MASIRITALQDVTSGLFLRKGETRTFVDSEVIQALLRIGAVVASPERSEATREVPLGLLPSRRKAAEAPPPSTAKGRSPKEQEDRLNRLYLQVAKLTQRVVELENRLSGEPPPPKLEVPEEEPRRRGRPRKEDRS